MIRRAEIGDINAINDLLCQVLDIHAAGRPDIFRSGVKKYSDAELVEMIRDDNTPIFVSVLDGAVVGYAFCIYKQIKDNPILKDAKILYIDDLCVDQGHRGQHVGQELYHFALQEAKNNSCDRVELNVWSLNSSAMKFYERCGLTPQKIMMEIKVDKEDQ